VLYAHKFQGNPVRIFALKYSIKAIAAEKKNKELKSSFKYGPIIKIINAMNKLKNNGINIKANGINILKSSLKVREFVIHDIPLR
tara:strand:+ start:160 stop:414 length:255 start_codon:yes stop_codon:yes gene_type:complete